MRCVVNVATGRYVIGQRRLESLLSVPLVKWADSLPEFSPTHAEVPYAFKAWALHAACKQGFTTLLWADACIVPLDLTQLFERIERDGYWMGRNGDWTNEEWTADSAYKDLGITREHNQIPHVVATAFGISLNHRLGVSFLEEYLRLAQTKAFCGPWWNSTRPENADKAGAAPCGFSAVRGHRHDQSAASVIAHRLKFKLTDSPDVFAYRGQETEKTVLIADGAYA